MGMFDYVQCHKELPWPEAADFGPEWQTKSMDAPYCDNYEIRADGTLWHEAYETEDRSDPNAEGLMAICGMMTRVNERWEQVEFTGELEIHHMVSHPDRPGHWWYTVLFWFRDGVVRDMVCSKWDSMAQREASNG